MPPAKTRRGRPRGPRPRYMSADTRAAVKRQTAIVTSSIEAVETAEERARAEARKLGALLNGKR